MAWPDPTFTSQCIKKLIRVIALTCCPALEGRGGGALQEEPAPQQHPPPPQATQETTLMVQGCPPMIVEELFAKAMSAAIMSCSKIALTLRGPVCATTKEKIQRQVQILNQPLEAVKSTHPGSVLANKGSHWESSQLL